MTNINPNKQGRTHRARKQLKRFALEFRDNFDDYTAVQRWGLVKRTMLALLRIHMHDLGQYEDD